MSAGPVGAAGDGEPDGVPLDREERLEPPAPAALLARLRAVEAGRDW